MPICCDESSPAKCLLTYCAECAYNTSTLIDRVWINLSKSILGADLDRAREDQLFSVALAQAKRLTQVTRDETCFGGKGTQWKGSLSDKLSHTDTAR